MDKKSMFLIAGILLALDILFTWISFIINPISFATMEINPYVMHFDQWWKILVMNLVWFGLFKHSLELGSKFYVFIYGSILIGFRTFAVLSHPCYWMYLAIPNITAAMIVTILQLLLSILVFVVCYKRWLNDRDQRSKEKVKYSCDNHCCGTHCIADRKSSHTFSGD